MRFLLLDEIDGALSRGQSVEQFLGKGITPDSISWLELRPTEGKIEIWAFEVEDVGDSEYRDIYSFPITGVAPEEPLATLGSAEDALLFAQANCSAPPSQWHNQGVIQNLYTTTKA